MLSFQRRIYRSVQRFSGGQCPDAAGPGIYTACLPFCAGRNPGTAALPGSAVFSPLPTQQLQLTKTQSMTLTV